MILQTPTLPTQETSKLPQMETTTKILKILENLKLVPTLFFHSESLRPQIQTPLVLPCRMDFFLVSMFLVMTLTLGMFFLIYSRVSPYSIYK